jgi:hypothetical protein
MQKITADFPQQLCDQIAQLECVVSPRYNPSIWLLGCDRKEEIRTQHPRTSQLLYPCCVADIFSRLPVQTGRLENVFQERPLLQSFTNLLLQIKRAPPQTLERNVGPGQYNNACSGVESREFQSLLCSSSSNKLSSELSSNGLLFRPLVLLYHEQYSNIRSQWS